MSVVAFVYALLFAFVFSVASRNRRDGRGNPVMVVWTGYALVGLTIGLAGAGLVLAAMGVDVAGVVDAGIA